MSIDVLEDYPAGNRMQGLCVSLSKDNITVSGCTLKEEKKKSKKEKNNNNPVLGEKKKKGTYLNGCGAQWEKYDTNRHENAAFDTELALVKSRKKEKKIKLKTNKQKNQTPKPTTLNSHG